MNQGWWGGNWENEPLPTNREERKYREKTCLAEQSWFFSAAGQEELQYCEDASKVFSMKETFWEIQHNKIASANMKDWEEKRHSVESPTKSPPEGPQGRGWG